MGTDCHFAIEAKINGVWCVVVFRNDWMEMKRFLRGKAFRVVEPNAIAFEACERDEDNKKWGGDDYIAQVPVITSHSVSMWLLIKNIFGDPSKFINTFVLRLSDWFHVYDVFITTLNRDYPTFSRLAGVRWRNEKSCAPRGFPKNISNAVQLCEVEHTPTHFYHDEVPQIPELRTLFGNKIRLIENTYPEYRILIYFDS